jgi:hypothetical protein
MPKIGVNGGGSSNESSKSSSSSSSSSKNSSTSSFSFSDNSGNNLNIGEGWPTTGLGSKIPKVNGGKVDGSLTINGADMITVSELSEEDANAYLNTIKSKYSNNQSLSTYTGGFLYGGDDGTTQVGLMYGEKSLVITVTPVESDS